jgi:hypothetical protein
LNRNYFPGVDLNSFDENAKTAIINEIEEDLSSHEGIVNFLSKLSLVYTQLLCITKLLKKLENTPCHE